MIDAPNLNTTGTHVGFSSQAPDRAPELFSSALARFAPVQAAKVQELPQRAYGETEVLSWTSPDGREIEGFVTYPPGHAAGQRSPLLLIVHGGPAGVSTRWWPVASRIPTGWA